MLFRSGEDFWDNYPASYNSTISPDDIKLFIGRIFQYGYTGTISTSWRSQNEGGDKLAHAVATQLLIWETVIGERDENFNKVSTGGRDAVLDQISRSHPIYDKIMSYYNSMAASVQKHSKLPSFLSKTPGSAQEIELKWDGSKYTVTLTDSNNVLSGYKFSSNNSGVQFSVSGNKLTITAEKAPSDGLTITAEKTAQRKGVITWTDDVLGNIDDELQEANAGASMAVDTDNISNKADNTYNTHKAGTDDADKETEPTVPPTLSSEEVMAEAMKNFAFDESNKLAWPVLGQIVLDYNMDETIFFKSLGMYKCNPAIIIQSEVGTNVAAAASGIVTDVANLSETGTTVTVSIGNGYETTTGLIENVNLKKGDKVVAGQLIGTVASPSAYYIEEGPGVYFKLTQYGEPINPDTYFVE